MASDQVKRKLAAILAADIAGYSRLMGADEAGTLARLKEYRRELIAPKNKQYRGRVVKTTGDGILIEFPSVVDAVSCSIEVQQGMRERNADVATEKRIDFRIGINLGDVLIEGRDLYGDGVNIAARLEGLAEPGGICISQTVLNHARGKIAFEVEDLGEQALKNIAKPIHVYRVLLNSSREPVMGRSRDPALALPDKPSIAVLPFQNMSGDPEQEYFTDGMVEEIITGLSRMRWLFVIARNSSFAYKGKSPDIRQVGRELGVRYVLEGGVRKAANRLRITGQLIDASTGAHLWADRFDGGLEDVFELQDHVTSSVIGAIAPKLEQAEIERAKHKPTENLDAYDYYLRGLSLITQTTRDANNEALRLFRKAIELDTDFAAPHGMAAWCYVVRKVNGFMIDRGQEVLEATRLAYRATALDKDDAVALCWGGYALGYVAGDLDAAMAFVDQALGINQNLAAAWNYSGWLRIFAGEQEAAIERMARAMRLSPRDPTVFHMRAGTAFAHFFAGRYLEAVKWAQDALRDQPNFVGTLRIVAASHALGGRLEEAQKAMARIRQFDPELRVANLEDRLPPLRPEDFARYAEGLRKAGLPE
jgi:TolB-like protein/class 3 adenylate cyclase/tetratricopeptide (TPR) repeat protein